VLITTLTKRSAEELTDYLRDLGIKVRYLHSDIDSLERTALIRDLRLGVFDVLVGINLLREGLDIPEVTLVAVLDADKEGFLRNRTSLIQTCGRAARNVEGRVILYADKRTDSIEAAIAEMDRRRTKQLAHNEEFGITPTTIIKPVRDLMEAPPDEDGELPVPGQKKGKRSKGRGKQQAGNPVEASGPVPSAPKRQFKDHKEMMQHVKLLRAEMMAAAKNLDFELAARIRDEVYRLEKVDMELL
jgi:excinuclease ABC subunit B